MSVLSIHACEIRWKFFSKFSLMCTLVLCVSLEGISQMKHHTKATNASIHQHSHQGQKPTVSGPNKEM